MLESIYLDDGRDISDWNNEKKNEAIELLIDSLSHTTCAESLQDSVICVLKCIGGGRLAAVDEKTKSQFTLSVVQLPEGWEIVYGGCQFSDQLLAEVQTQLTSQFEQHKNKVNE